MATGNDSLESPHLGKICPSPFSILRLGGRFFPRPEPDVEWRPDRDPHPRHNQGISHTPDSRPEPHGECILNPRPEPTIVEPRLFYFLLIETIAGPAGKRGWGMLSHT
jgi:hypothetical protein